MSVARQEYADEYYPNHEEDSVPEHSEHEYQVWALRTTLRRRLPQHFITGDVCMYWIRGDSRTYRAPDVLVVEGREGLHPDGNYCKWRDPAALFVVEISSRSTQKADEGPKVDIFLEHLEVPEYLFFDRLRPRIRLWRRSGAGVEEAAPNAAGRFEVRSLGIEFGIGDDGRMRLFEPDGTMLPAPEEVLEELDAQRQRAEFLAAQAAQERQKAEAERQKADAERQRAAALEQELERLRRELARRNGTAGSGGE